MLNLFIAVIVNAIQSEHEIELRDKAEAEAADREEVNMHEELRALKEEVRALRTLLTDRRGYTG
jgi:voltage-gated sodium channel